MLMLVSDLLEYRSYITDNTVIYIRRNGCLALMMAG